MNKVALRSALGALCLLAAVPAAAQQLELPAASPPAMVKQRVGLTDVTVEYSSPGVKGRAIFGGLVPWDKPWRTGANASTKITFSKDVTFGGKPVPAGTYAIVSIPGQKTWTVILSKATDLYSGGKQYDPKDDAARVEVTATEIPARERLTFLFSNTTDDATTLDLEWATLKVSVPVLAQTSEQAKANIDAALNNAWRNHLAAARYMADTAGDLPTALKYAEQSIAIKSTWFNNWIKADILARQGKYKDARKFAQVAWDLGQKDSYFFYKAQVEKALADWKNKK